MFYILGSLLFTVTLVVSLSVIASNLLHYREKMMAALRMLSLDGVTAHTAPAPAVIAPVRKVRPVAVPVRTVSRPAVQSLAA